MGIGNTIGLLLIAFAIAALFGYWLTDRRRAGRTKPPEVGTTLRLRATSGMYRTKLVAIEPHGWRVSAPLSRNHYVPLRTGETLTVEAPVEGGVYLFKTIVAARETETHELILQAPAHVVPTNRRTIARCLRDEPVKVDGQDGQLVDISALGARVKTAKRFSPGDRVRLDLREGLMYAWVLDAWPTRHGDAWRENVRLRFEATHEKACT